MHARYDADSYNHVSSAIQSAIPQEVMRELWRHDPDGGETEPTEQDYARFRAWVLKTYGPRVHDAYFGNEAP